MTIRFKTKNPIVQFGDMVKNLIIFKSYSGESSISQTYNANREGGGFSHYVAKYFPKNCMKWEEFNEEKGTPTWVR